MSSKKKMSKWLEEIQKKNVKELSKELKTLSKFVATEKIRLRMGESKKSSDYREARKKTSQLVKHLNQQSSHAN